MGPLLPLIHSVHDVMSQLVANINARCTTGFFKNKRFSMPEQGTSFGHEDALQVLRERSALRAPIMFDIKSKYSSPLRITTATNLNA